MWLIIANYDAFVSQILPEEFATKAPKVWKVVSVTSGRLSWKEWLLVLVVVFILIQFEYIYRGSQKNKNAKVNENELRTAEENTDFTFIVNQTTNHSHIYLNYGVLQQSVVTNRAIVRFRPDKMSVLNALNVSSITNNAAGDYTIHLTKPMNLVSMACVAMSPTLPASFRTVNETASAVRVIFDGTEPEIIALRIDD